ncbi:hypothetical protein HanXRQr2_Chr09g0379741 [Helianthus annuus]|uniref:Uncharacterized protein n=1 Tax=Helianthus annuus TaxID=4232 RepID=A0A9K3I4T6_HELAN|nr:hypothetical protein HanXRQr2_Chr09g0379741 [Helianthus annuus]
MFATIVLSLRHQLCPMFFLFLNTGDYYSKFRGFWLFSRVLIAHKGGKVVAAELGNALYSLGYAI